MKNRVFGEKKARCDGLGAYFLRKVRFDGLGVSFLRKGYVRWAARRMLGPMAWIRFSLENVRSDGLGAYSRENG